MLKEGYQGGGCLWQRETAGHGMAKHALEETVLLLRCGLIQMKKALIVTTVSGFVPQFEMNNVRILQKLGYTVHYASNFKTPVYGEDNRRLDGSGIVRHQVDFVRSPFRIRENLRAYGQLKRVIEQGDYDVIHCHTPMGGALARLAAHRSGVRAKVIYTAHGFHFYQGAPIWNWLIYYPVERWLARYTDLLITINREDYRRAKEFRLNPGGRAVHVPGVGVPYPAERRMDGNKGKEAGHIYTFVSVGELSRRKNHQAGIRAAAYLKQFVPGVKFRYLIYGKGPKKAMLSDMIRTYGLEDCVWLAGYEPDPEILYGNADCILFPSLQEGLPMALMEAMTWGLPVIASAIRGNDELVVPEKGGYLVEKQDVRGYALKMKNLIDRPDLGRQMGAWNEALVSAYSQTKVMKKMESYYRWIQRSQ